MFSANHLSSPTLTDLSSSYAYSLSLQNTAFNCVSNLNPLPVLALTTAWYCLLYGVNMQEYDYY